MLISSQVMLIFSPWAVLSELIGSLVAESLWRRLLLIEPNCGSLTAVVANKKQSAVCCQVVVVVIAVFVLLCESSSFDVAECSCLPILLAVRNNGLRRLVHSRCEHWGALSAH